MKTSLTRHLASALAALWFEHKAVRREYVILISKGDRKLARRLSRALEDDAHYSECIELEHHLNKPQRQYAKRLVKYELQVGNIIDELTKLLNAGIRLP